MPLPSAGVTVRDADQRTARRPRPSAYPAPPQFSTVQNGQKHIRKMSNYLVATFLLAGAVTQARARAISSAFASSVQTNQNFMRARISAKSSICMMADQKIRVFLVRHGAVDLNSPGMVYPKDCFYGGQNVPLSSLGKVEAQVEFTYAAFFVKTKALPPKTAPIHSPRPNQT